MEDNWRKRYSGSKWIALDYLHTPQHHSMDLHRDAYHIWTRKTWDNNITRTDSIVYLALREHFACSSWALSLNANARSRLLTYSKRHESVSTLLATPDLDLLKEVANSDADWGNEATPARGMRPIGSVTETKKSAVVCRCAGSYLCSCQQMISGNLTNTHPISIKYCLAWIAGPKYAIRPS